MICRECAVHVSPDWTIGYFGNQLAVNNNGWMHRSAECPNCQVMLIDICQIDSKLKGLLRPESQNWVGVQPQQKRTPLSEYIPVAVQGVYYEARGVLCISASASAALSRRCLQMILHEFGYRARDLNSEINMILAESDPGKILPASLRQTIDVIRNFGNFSAHPITEITSLQIIEVEPNEAEWCLEILEEMFEHFYIRPKTVAARKAALDAKLGSAGKPRSK